MLFLQLVLLVVLLPGGDSEDGESSGPAQWAHVCMCVFVCVCVCMFLSAFVHLCVCACEELGVCMFVYLCLYMHMGVYFCVSVCVLVACFHTYLRMRESACFLPEHPQPQGPVLSRRMGARLRLWGSRCLLRRLWLLCPPDFGSRPRPRSLHSLSFPMSSSSSVYLSFPTDFQELISFQIILTTSFYSRSWTQNVGSVWLDELQTHGWDSDSGTFTCMWPWSRGNFSNKELMEEQRSFHTFSIRFPLIFQDHFSEWQLEYPFQVQAAKGCELHIGETSVGFMRIAYQGEDLVFPEQVMVAISKRRKEGSAGVQTTQSIPRDQLRPEAWLSTGPSPRPDHLRLVCHVSGFYPKPMWVTWMRGEQEQQGTWRGDVLPHADGTWYRQVSLDVKVKETAGLSCRVRHSSLGGQDIVLHWGEKELGPAGKGVIVLLVFLAGLAW
uniref:T-cell surface glycoprotein CD1a-like n=1 Tax=Nyctereutes procyonoides TaxID=34880 RepID=UPI00244412BF|nr:T-cell surface glycoprotein CD1a-like [Nyctereutes procyonoides]